MLDENPANARGPLPNGQFSPFSLHPDVRLPLNGFILLPHLGSRRRWLLPQPVGQCHLKGLRSTALAGRILDANDFDLGIETPVVGATVAILGAGVSAISDANGDFTLSGIPSGSQVFDIDASTANPAPNGAAYAGFREAVELIADVTNVVDRPFFLPRLGAAYRRKEPSRIRIKAQYRSSRESAEMARSHVGIHETARRF